MSCLRGGQGIIKLNHIVIGSTGPDGKRQSAILLPAPPSGPAGSTTQNRAGRKPGRAKLSCRWLSFHRHAPVEQGPPIGPSPAFRSLLAPSQPDSGHGCSGLVWNASTAGRPPVACQARTPTMPMRTDHLGTRITTCWNHDNGAQLRLCCSLESAKTPDWRLSIRTQHSSAPCQIEDSSYHEAQESEATPRTYTEVPDQGW